MRQFPPGTDALFEDAPPEDDRQREIRHMTVKQMEIQRKKAYLRMVGWLLFAMVPLFIGAMTVLNSTDQRIMLLGFFAMVAGLETSVLIKLWFWIVSTNNTTMQQLKQIQLQVAAIEERTIAAQPGMPQGEDR